MKSKITANTTGSCIACIKIAFVCFVMIKSGMMSNRVAAESEMDEFQQIQGLFEPSGVVQLSDGRLLVVEDEPANPFLVLTPNANSRSFSIKNLRLNTLLHPAMKHVNDLEGVAKDHDGYIYAITSHSRKSNGKRDPNREKILMFSVKEDHILSSNVRIDFRKQLIKAFPALKEAAKERDVKDERGLNIEGITFSPDGNVLWIGLRAPLFAEKAILIGVLNPRGALESGDPFQFINDHVALDLDGGGIRDIAYDPTLSGYLVLSQRENTKKDRAFKLWLWNGDEKAAPERVRISGIKKLNRTEGIASVNLTGKDKLLLLNDDGNRNRNTPASYLVIDYTQLDIEAVP